MVGGDYSRDYRTLEFKLGWPNSLTAHLEKELRAHFVDAWISGYEPLISQMTNDEKIGTSRLPQYTSRRRSF